MRPPPVCPRCGLSVRAPGVWSSAWTCETHGEVDPYHPAVRPSGELLLALARTASLPVWLPWPLPEGWLLTGVAHAGDERTGTRAIAVACSGPAPLGGLGELVLVAEPPGVGLGAGLAGRDGLDPGAAVTTRVPESRVMADGHPTALWAVDAPADRTVLVGEAHGHWLWVLFWPADASHLLAESLLLVDVRTRADALDVPVGALSPRLVHARTGA